MNFLSHYYIDRQEEDPMFVIGVMLPDLWRGFSRQYNSNVRHRPAEAHPTTRGIHRHYQVDRLFHGSEPFVKATTAIRALLLKTDLQHRRPSFLAHLLYELMLDRQIMLEDPAHLKGYYALLDRVDPAGLQDYLKNVDLEQDTIGLVERFQRFRELQFMYSYATDSGMVDVVDRVGRRLFGAMSPESRRQLMSSLPDIADFVKLNWRNTFNHIEKALI